MTEFRFGPNRYVCTALAEMRALLGTLESVTMPRYKIIQASLIEEVQILANRMESGISDIHDIQELKKKRDELKDELIKLTDIVRKAKLEANIGEDK